MSLADQARRQGSRGSGEVPERGSKAALGKGSGARFWSEVLERFRNGSGSEAKFCRGSGEVRERFWSEVPEGFRSEVLIGSEKVLE